MVVYVGVRLCDLGSGLALFKKLWHWCITFFLYFLSILCLWKLSYGQDFTAVSVITLKLYIVKVLYRILDCLSGL